MSGSIPLVSSSLAFATPQASLEFDVLLAVALSPAANATDFSAVLRHFADQPRVQRVEPRPRSPPRYARMTQWCAFEKHETPRADVRVLPIPLFEGDQSDNAGIPVRKPSGV